MTKQPRFEALSHPRSNINLEGFLHRVLGLEPTFSLHREVRFKPMVSLQKEMKLEPIISLYGVHNVFWIICGLSNPQHLRWLAQQPNWDCNQLCI